MSNLNMFKKLSAIGKKCYRLNVWREKRRYYTFMLRALFNRTRMKKIDTFFTKNDELRQIADIYPYGYEQPTRAFFYCGSTFDERIAVVENHMDFMLKLFKFDIVKEIYSQKEFLLWNDADILDNRLKLVMFFHSGQRKEGLLSLILRLDKETFYQIMFWLSPDKNGEPSLFIGAMQGPNIEDARDAVKKVTKACHSLRPKNFILYAVQAFARALQIKHIYAVTNQGYYANNHVRVDRKLKTDFSEFWREAGGWETGDPRFYELPLTEKRKTMEEVPTRKRAVYRRRFVLMDEIDEMVAEKIMKLLK